AVVGTVIGNSLEPAQVNQRRRDPPPRQQAATKRRARKRPQQNNHLPAPVSAEVPAPADEDEVEDESDIETFAAERRVAESRLNQLSNAYAAEMANRQHIRDSGEVPPGNNYAAGIKHIWTNKGESAQAYDNRQGYLPVTGAPYTEKYTALTGGSQHGRMITPNAPVASLLANKPPSKSGIRSVGRTRQLLAPSGRPGMEYAGGVGSVRPTRGVTVSASRRNTQDMPRLRLTC
ncbi:MAG: hypothetical protein QOK48_1852, partial [Blastocatellia bacterium]|nr:hypothetical protein [Blastocatellia bacterium]